MSPWVLAIDYGTTASAAAIAVEGKPAQLLDIESNWRFPSVVLVDSSGELVTGKAARNRLPINPARGERTPKRYLGQLPRLPIGDGIPVVDAVAAVLERLVTEARRQCGDTDPARVVLTHPARWDETRLDLLLEAAKQVGIIDPDLVSEPVAAAFHFAAERPPAPGEHVGVYDLGGGTLDTAVLRALDDGFEVAGPPGGDAGIGGESFDDLLSVFVLRQVAAIDPDLAARLATPVDTNDRIEAFELREWVRDAKEALSNESVADVHIKRLERSFRITREEFEALIEPVVTESVDDLEATVRAAGLKPADLAALYLTGDATRIPAIGRAIHARLAPVAPTTWGNPKSVVVLGALRYAHALDELARRCAEEEEARRLEAAEAARQRDEAAKLKARKEKEAAKLKAREEAAAKKAQVEAAERAHRAAEAEALKQARAAEERRRAAEEAARAERAAAEARRVEAERAAREAAITRSPSRTIDAVQGRAVFLSPDARVLGCRTTPSELEQAGERPDLAWFADTITGKQVGAVTLAKGSSMALTPDWRIGASFGAVGPVSVWRPGSGELVGTVEPPTASPTKRLGRALFGYTAARVAGGGHDLAVLYALGGARPLALAANADVAAMIGEDRQVTLWRPSDGAVLRSMAEMSAANLIHCRLALSPDGRLLAVRSGSMSLQVWYTETSFLVRTLQEPGDATFSPDGRWLTLADDLGLALCDVSAAQWIHTTPLSPVRRLPWTAPVAFTPDGAVVAACSPDGVSIALWRPDNGVELRRLPGHGPLAFSADGRVLAACATDHRINLWRVDSGEHLAILDGHTAGVTDLAISRDGRTVIAACADSTLRIWAPR